MKKIFLLLTAIVCFNSCKKAYTCTCETSYTYLVKQNSFTPETYTTVVMPGNNTAYSEKMSSRQAKADCDHEQNAIETDFTDGVTGEGSTPLKKGESVSTTCELK